MKMIAVLEVRTSLVDSERMKMAVRRPAPSSLEMESIFSPAAFMTEEIRGRRFTNNRGETVCIGMSKQAEEAIGLPFEVFEKLTVSNKNLREDLIDARADISASENRHARTIELWRDDVDRYQSMRNRIARLSFKDRVKVFFTILFGTLVLQDIVGIK